MLQSTGSAVAVSLFHFFPRHMEALLTRVVTDAGSSKDTSARVVRSAASLSSLPFHELVRGIVVRSGFFMVSSFA